MSVEKTDETVAEDTAQGRNSLKIAIILFSIVEALVVIAGIVYGSRH
ncbi:MAG TPA: hypothetical protein VKB86_20770 [Pyrinomonadaceae bacterium]|nr:hypothetical protein [Pyrinomonadaceae bacterium]